MILTEYTIAQAVKIGKNVQKFSLRGKANKLIGKIPWNAYMLLWGGAGGGKSTLALTIAGGIAAQTHRKVQYFSSEEKLNKGTIQEKIELTRTYHNNLAIIPCTQNDDIMPTIQREKPAAIVLDSINAYVPDNPGRLYTLVQEYPEAIWIAIAHADKTKRAYSGKGLAKIDHLFDITIHVQNKVARTTKNRWAMLTELTL